MSLIDEALKRARMEAAQKAAEGEGLPYPTIPRHLGPRRRRGWLAPLVLLLAVLGGVAVGVMLASRSEPAADHVAASNAAGATAADAMPAPPAPAAEATDPPANIVQPEALPGPVASAPQAGGPATPPAAGAEPRPGSSPSASRRPEEPTADRGSTGPSTASAAQPSAPAADTASTTPAQADPPGPEPGPSRPPTTPGATATTVTDPDSGVLLVLPDRQGSVGQPAAGEATESAESHVQQVSTNDGAIELGGIAWSETGPFALINGRVVDPGSVIGGYTLEAIRPGHVVLSGEGRRIHLSLQ